MLSMLSSRGDAAISANIVDWKLGEKTSPLNSFRLSRSSPARLDVLNGTAVGRRREVDRPSRTVLHRDRKRVAHPSYVRDHRNQSWQPSILDQIVRCFAHRLGPHRQALLGVFRPFTVVVRGVSVGVRAVRHVHGIRPSARAAAAAAAAVRGVVVRAVVVVAAVCAAGVGAHPRALPLAPAGHRQPHERQAADEAASEPQLQPDNGVDLRETPLFFEFSL